VPSPPAGGPPRVELLDSGGPARWEGRPTSPTRARGLVAGLAVLVLLGGGLLFVRNWSAEREVRQAVELTVTFGLWSSSTTRPGGEVRFFVLVRNDGALPVAVTSVDAADAGLRLRMRDEGERPIGPGKEIEIPLSVLVSCVPGTGSARPSLAADIGVRREDGGTTSRPAELRPATLVLDVAATLCGVRPELRDHELSGPVLRDPADR
jgi:hypothetical protein